MQRKKKTTPSPQSSLFLRLLQTQFDGMATAEYRFHPVRLWRFDYALPSYRVAIEVEGGVWTAGRHIRPQGFLGDVEKYNAAATLGWRILRTTPQDMLSSAFVETIREACNASEDFTEKNLQ